VYGPVTWRNKHTGQIKTAFLHSSNRNALQISDAMEKMKGKNKSQYVSVGGNVCCGYGNFTSEREREREIVFSEVILLENKS